MVIFDSREGDVAVALMHGNLSDSARGVEVINGDMQGASVGVLAIC